MLGLRGLIETKRTRSVAKPRVPAALVAGSGLGPAPAQATPVWF